MRGTAENRAGAVLHQNKIGDIDRHMPALIEYMLRLEAGVVAELFGGFNRDFGCAAAVAFGNKARKLRIFFRQFCRERMIG